MKKKQVVKDIHGVQYQVGDLIRPADCPLSSLMWEGKAKCIREVIGEVYMDRQHKRPYMNAFTLRKGLAEFINDGKYYKAGDTWEFSIDCWDGVFNHWDSYEIINRSER